jgi:hypothetical protein
VSTSSTPPPPDWRFLDQRFSWTVKPPPTAVDLRGPTSVVVYDLIDLASDALDDDEPPR